MSRNNLHIRAELVGADRCSPVLQLGVAKLSVL